MPLAVFPGTWWILAEFCFVIPHYALLLLSARFQREAFWYPFVGRNALLDCLSVQDTAFTSLAENTNEQN